MKHGTRFWQKKLGRSPQHRADLLRNLLTSLVLHERMETTVAKTKFMKRAFDKMIETAKKGDRAALEKILFHLNPVGKTKKQEETIPKVLEKLVPRYATRTGGYTRLLLNGHRSVGSDRAPLAVIELVDNPKDTIYHLAKNTMPNIQQQLEKVHQEHYNQSQVTLFHPVTGEPQSAVKLEPKLSLRKDKVARLNKKERGIMKVKVKYEKALNSFPLARALEGLTIAEPMAEVPTSTASALPLTSSTETKDMTENKDQPPPPPTPSEPGTEDKKGWGFGDVFKKLGFK